MGWMIDHLPGGSRSGTQIANLMDRAAEHLTERDLAALAPIAARDGHNPFALTPAQAGDAAAVLLTLADRLSSRRWNREARGWGEFARSLAAAAHTAHRTGQPWHWN
ncbi:hypothetical protein RM844_30245 [Streptomyces sp. DSM 44915]|uniref:DUF7739 domain-containing protein n=1 Tax=Streptomyces chisholmiae TaxID=3075540 RepID=A0ABU2K0G0_9ACTN|nr:hypothetical protein [Streptomyces sp. DSM 44915]MDT0270562.1 hypothetical protein [Streptomyces sp. DSM 44915]